MSARTDAAVDRFVANARAILAHSSGRSDRIVELCGQLVAAADQGDAFEARTLVLEINRLGWK